MMEKVLHMLLKYTKKQKQISKQMKKKQNNFCLPNANCFIKVYCYKISVQQLLKDDCASYCFNPFLKCVLSCKSINFTFYSYLTETKSTDLS